MTMRRERVTFENMLAAVESLLEQVKVLVAAVDDLRCEVEWQAKQIATAELSCKSEAALEPLTSSIATVQAEDQPLRPNSPVNDISSLTAVGRLCAWEQLHSRGLQGSWSDEWAERDDVEMPLGRVIPVDVDTWSSVLDIRPAHVIDEGCCCEEGEGAPYLLAWQSGEEYFLRELTDEEARRLQELCLACQAKQADQAKPSVCDSPTATQLGLF